MEFGLSILTTVLTRPFVRGLVFKITTSDRDRFRNMSFHQCPKSMDANSSWIKLGLNYMQHILVWYVFYMVVLD